MRATCHHSRNRIRCNSGAPVLIHSHRSCIRPGLRKVDGVRGVGIVSPSAVVFIGNKVGVAAAGVTLCRTTGCDRNEVSPRSPWGSGVADLRRSRRCSIGVNGRHFVVVSRRCREAAGSVTGAGNSLATTVVGLVVVPPYTVYELIVQFAGGAGAVQLKPMLLDVVDVTVNAVGAAVTAEQVVPPVVAPLPCAEYAEFPSASTACTT